MNACEPISRTTIGFSVHYRDSVRLYTLQRTGVAFTQPLAQSCQRARYVFFHGLVRNPQMTGDFGIAHAFDAIEQINFPAADRW